MEAQTSSRPLPVHSAGSLIFSITSEAEMKTPWGRASDRALMNKVMISALVCWAGLAKVMTSLLLIFSNLKVSNFYLLVKFTYYQLIRSLSLYHYTNLLFCFRSASCIELFKRTDIHVVSAVAKSGHWAGLRRSFPWVRGVEFSENYRQNGSLNIFPSCCPVQRQAFAEDKLLFHRFLHINHQCEVFWCWTTQIKVIFH